MFKNSTFSPKTSNSVASNRSDAGDSLLEEWPAPKPLVMKTVTIAKYSEQRSFPPYSRSYTLRKSYSSHDVELFKDKAFQEARRIYKLISRFPVGTGCAIQSVLGLGLLKQEELIGLEHIVTPKAVEKHVQGRQSHVAVVLRAQEELRRAEGSSDVSTLKLAKVASTSSSKNVKKAKIRALMSLQAENVDPESSVRSRKTRNRRDHLSCSVTSRASVSSKESRSRNDALRCSIDSKTSVALKDEQIEMPTKVSDSSSATSTESHMLKTPMTLEEKLNSPHFSSFTIARRTQPMKEKRTYAHAA